ncbi:MAG TPA: CapA family protein [bacterium]|nr:CapA family protein [bacterium]
MNRIRTGVFPACILIIASAIGPQGEGARSVPEGAKDTLTLAAVGDLMMGGRVLPFIELYGMHYPFDSTRATIRSADIAMANLEAPFTLTGKPFEKTYTFRVPPDLAPALADAGFDVMTLANNHILDFGPEGLTETMETLDRLSVLYCGAGKDRKQAERAAVLETGGWRVGFLAYSMTYPSEFWADQNRGGAAYPHPRRMQRQIASLADSVDAVVVSFHWGGERLPVPREYQRHFAHMAVDAGAHLIIGHHPHVLQGVEIYRGAFIAYSLGNYVFGSYSMTSQGLMLWAAFQNRALHSVRLLPMDVNNHRVAFQPRFLRGAAMKACLDEVIRLSGALNEKSLRVDDEGVIVMNQAGAPVGRHSDCEAADHGEKHSPTDPPSGH